MAKIIINQDKCKGCLLCVNFCPQGLIKKSLKLNKQGLNFVEFSCPDNLTVGVKPKACSGCMQCAIICPDCCIEVHK